MMSRNPGLDCEKEFEDCYTDEARNSLLNLQKSRIGNSVQKWLGSHLLIANSLLFGISLVMLLITSTRYHIPRDYCVRKLSFYCKPLQSNMLSTTYLTAKDYMSNDDVAPALKLLNDDYKTMIFIGHTEEGSPYQGPPNAQVDAQWKRLTKGYSLKSLLPCSCEVGNVNTQKVGPFSLNEELRAKIGAPDYAVKFPEESGGGYEAILESIHQLHCVVRAPLQSRYRN